VPKIFGVKKYEQLTVGCISDLLELYIW